VSAAGSYSGFTVNYDNFTTTTIETRDLSNLSTYVVGLSASQNGSTVRVEFVDRNGNVGTALLQNVGTTQQFYQISLNANVLNPLLDLSRIRFINFIIDQALVPVPVGSVTVTTKGLDFLGTLGYNPSLGLPDVTVLPNTPRASLTGGSSAASSITQTGDSQVDLVYDVSTPGSYSGIAVSYDNFATSTIEYQNLSSLGKIIVGVTGPAGSRVRVEIEDSRGNRRTILLEGIDATQHFYQLDFSLFPGIDFTRVRYINFVVDSSLVSPATGTVTLTTDGLFV